MRDLPANAARVMQASVSQPSFWTQPGPPHASVHMRGGSEMDAQALG